MCTNRI